MVTNCNYLLFFYGRISQGLGKQPPHTTTRNPCKVTYVKIKLSRAASFGHCRFQCIQIGRQSDQHPLTLFISPR